MKRTVPQRQFRRSGWGRLTTAAALALAGLSAAAAHAQPEAPAPTDSGYRWITLGTMGGPMPAPDRHQPANLLIKGNAAYLIDAGDGAASGMVAAGAYFPMLRAIWISHIHFDHIGGLWALLGLRLQTRTTAPLTIYGPPGTTAIIDGLLAAMRPSAELGFGVPGEKEIDPATGIKVVEVDDRSVVREDDFTVTVAGNCHYSFPPGSPMDKRFRSLSFRFDLPRRSIVYTGDTSPCASVGKLAEGADLLVSEMIDVGDTIAKVRQLSPDLPEAELAKVEEHLRTQHLSPADIGALARQAHVGAVAVTHIAGGGNRQAIADGEYAKEIDEVYAGPMTIARDGEGF